MRHPSEGTLRRLVDEPSGVGDLDREHVAGCPQCLTALAAAEQDAVLTRAALHVPRTGDVDAAWRRLTHATGPRPVTAAEGEGRRTRRRLRFRSPVVAGVGVLAVVTGASAAAAGDWLQIFHTEQVAPVTLSQEDLVALPDLSAYGDLEVLDEVEVREVPSATAAERATGLDAPSVEALPTGVSGQPEFEVVDEVRGTFTFSADEARLAAEREGEPLPAPPDGLDGTEFRLEAGPGLAAVWSEARGLPAMVVARAVAPTAFSSGVPFDTARDYLLSLPGVPEDLASQLRQFSADGTTLPVPVPGDLGTSSAADVGGAEATLVESRDGALAAVVWVEDGVVTVVAGSVTADEVLAVARGLE